MYKLKPAQSKTITVSRAVCERSLFIDAENNQNVSAGQTVFLSFNFEEFNSKSLSKPMSSCSQPADQIYKQKSC